MLFHPVSSCFILVHPVSSYFILFHPVSPSFIFVQKVTSSFTLIWSTQLDHCVYAAAPFASCVVYHLVVNVWKIIISS